MQMETAIGHSFGPSIKSQPLILKKGVPLQNRLPIPLDCGEFIPEHTTFVCERGGKNVKLVYWRESKRRYERLRMPKQDCCAFFVDTSPGRLPVSLALHFGLSLASHDTPSIVPGSYYMLLDDIKLADYRVLMKGEIVVCQSSNDVLSFKRHSDDEGASFYLPQADYVLLRFVAAAGSFVCAENKGSTWVH